MFKLFTIFYFFFAFSRALAQDWEASNYPNPTSQFAQCNMKSRSMVCDPDKVLNEQERYRLHYELNRLESLTKQPNGQNFCEKKGIVAGVAIAKHVRGNSEKAVKTLSNDLLKRWTLDQQCNKSIVILISTEDQIFWAARDPRVPVYANEFTNIFDSQKPLFKEGKYGEALINILSKTKEEVLAKQTQSDGGGGPPFNPKSAPTYPNDYNTRNKKPESNTGGMSFPKIPFWFWILLILIIMPLLCCCCCIYFCCCRGKSNDTPRRQASSNLRDEGGYPLTAPREPRSSGGGLQGFLGGMGGAAIGNTILGFFNRKGNAGASMPNSRPAGESGGFDDPPAYQTGPPGRSLYPSVNVKDEGGGGQW